MQKSTCRAFATGNYQRDPPCSTTELAVLVILTDGYLWLIFMLDEVVVALLLLGRGRRHSLVAEERPSSLGKGRCHL